MGKWVRRVISELLDISRWKKVTENQQKCLISVKFSLFSYVQQLGNKKVRILRERMVV